MDLTKTYIAFAYDCNRKGEIINKERQTQAFVNHVKMVHRKEPLEIIYGPLVDANGQVRVKTYEVYIMI